MFFLLQFGDSNDGVHVENWKSWWQAMCQNVFFKNRSIHFASANSLLLPILQRHGRSLTTAKSRARAEAKWTVSHRNYWLSIRINQNLQKVSKQHGSLDSCFIICWKPPHVFFRFLHRMSHAVDPAMPCWPYGWSVSQAVQLEDRLQVPFVGASGHQVFPGFVGDDLCAFFPFDKNTSLFDGMAFWCLQPVLDSSTKFGRNDPLQHVVLLCFCQRWFVNVCNISIWELSNWQLGCYIFSHMLITKLMGILGQFGTVEPATCVFLHIHITRYVNMTSSNSVSICYIWSSTGCWHIRLSYYGTWNFQLGKVCTSTSKLHRNTWWCPSGWQSSSRSLQGCLSRSPHPKPSWSSQVAQERRLSRRPVGRRSRSRRIRKIRDLYKLGLIETLVAMAKDLLQDELLCPAVLAATSKRYKEPEEKIVQRLKPPRFFISSSFVHMLRDNILRGSYEKRMPALYEQGFSLGGLPWVAKRVNAYLTNLKPSVHKFKLDTSNCDATLPPELISGRNFLVAHSNDHFC